MRGGFPYQPKILRGAFVEYGLSVPPLMVVFQFNPERITRSRTSQFSESGANERAERRAERRGERASETPTFLNMREFFKKYTDLNKLRDAQQASVQEESISFDIRLDATDGMNEGELLSTQFGIAPQLATLELLMLPKKESAWAEYLPKKGFSASEVDKPPICLFIWGRKRVLPVNITSMNIVEEEYTPELNPIRATIGVTLQVIEGENEPYKYTRLMSQTMSALNIANLPNTGNTIWPY